MIRKIAALVMAAELLLLVLIPLAAWTANMVGLSAMNLFAEEGIRWFCLHFGALIMPPYMALLVLLLQTVGAWQTAKLLQWPLTFTRERIMAFSTMAILLLLLFMPIILNYTPLLSVTGGLLLSPWLSIFPYALCIIVWFTSLIYAVQTQQIHSFADVLEMLVCGPRLYVVLMPIVMLANLLYGITLYVLPSY